MIFILFSFLNEKLLSFLFSSDGLSLLILLFEYLLYFGGMFLYLLIFIAGL
jgi:hypothetical protein